MGKKLNIAIIGTGFWAKYQIQACPVLPREAMELVAFCGTQGISDADAAVAQPGPTQIWSLRLRPQA